MIAKALQVTKDLALASLAVGACFVAGVVHSRNHAAKEAQSIEQLIQDRSRFVVPIRVTTGRDEGYTMGSGELIRLPSKQTAILTNAHVCKGVEGTNRLKYTVVNGRKIYDIQILKISDNPDLCVYYSPAILQEPGLVPYSIEYKYGMPLMEIGYPLNGPQTPSFGRWLFHNSAAIIGEPAKTEEDCGPGTKYVTDGFFNLCLTVEDLQETTVTTFPGNSGSPVFTMGGYMVGTMNSADGEQHNGNFISGKIVKQFLKGL